MPKFALLVAAILVLVLALLFDRNHDSAAAPLAATESDAQAELHDALTPTEQGLESKAETNGREEVAVSTDSPADGATDEPGPRCLLLGRFVDASNRPLAGLSVQLAAWKAWNEAGAGEALSAFRGRPTDGMVGFTTITDENGAFEFRVPPPTADGCSLFAAGDRFIDSYSQRFGFDDPRSLPAIVEGLRDLGSIQLAATGALFGQVSSESGQPLAGVRIGIGPSSSTTYSRDVETDANGRYVVGHAPAGTYGIKARAEQYLAEFKEPVAVEVGLDTGPIDFTLKTAPTISGQVVDVDGTPISGVNVGGWPQSSGSGAWKRSDSNGNFVIPLPQEEPYTLEATHPDYATWGNKRDGTTLFAPGTTGLRIEMAPSEKTRFHVVSAENGTSLESFGLRIYADEGSKAQRSGSIQRTRPPLETHEGGVFETAASEGVDAVLVWAPGYVLTELDVEHDDGVDGKQTISLPLGATITGRLIKDGSPVVNASVEVSAMRKRNGHVDPKTVLRGTTDLEGQFAISGIAKGMRSLTVHPPGDAELVVEGLLTNPPETLDVGDLEVVASGAIEGLCRFPSGMDPSGLTIYLGGWQKDVTATTDDSGRFRFDRVSPGKHEVSSDDRPGALFGGATASVEVESGGVARVELDLTDRALYSVQIEVVHGDLPLDKAQVYLEPLQPDPGHDRPGTILSDKNLGELNEDGIATGFVRALGPCHVDLSTRSSGRFRVPDVTVDLDGSGPVKARIELNLASVRLPLPPGAVLPVEGRLQVSLGTSREDPYTVQILRIPIRDGRLDAPGLAAQDGGAIVAHGLVPGKHFLFVEAITKDAPMVSTDLGDGRTMYGSEAMWTAGAGVTLEPGEVTEVALQ